jgi:hypothetical protein
MFSNAEFVCGDAANMGFPPESFDIVCESTRFTTAGHGIANADRKRNDVAKPHGFITLSDWRYKKPWSEDSRAFVAEKN